MPRIERPGSRTPRTAGSVNFVQGSTFIPQNIYAPLFKVEVTTTTDGVIDLNSYNGEPYVTEIQTTSKTLNRGLGDATIFVDNPNGLWNKKILGGEAITIYADYIGATNKIWSGRIDVALKNLDGDRGYFIKLLCRQRPELQDKAICGQFLGVTASAAVTSVKTEWFNSLITLNNLATMSTLLYRDYTWKQAHQVLRDIFNKAGYVAYLDTSNDVHSFIEEKNTTEYISIQHNCNVVDAYGADLQNRKNNVIMTGDRVESSNNLFFAWSKKDTSNISSFWQKDLVIAENSLNSQTNIESDCGLKLTDENKDFIEGSLNSWGGLPTLRPGQSIQCSIPLCDVDGWLQVHEFTHFINPTSWTTRVYFTKKLLHDERLFDLRDEAITGSRLSSSNPYSMTAAAVVKFSESPSLIASHSNTQEYESTLMLTTGQSAGNATSITKTFDYNITFIELRVYGENIVTSYYQVSADDGVTWENINLNEKHAVSSTSVNKKLLKVKWFLVKDTDNPTPKIWSSWCGVRFD